MTGEEWQRIRPILEAALELDPGERSSYLDRECSDASQRRELESLIAAHEQAETGVLAGPAVAAGLADEDRAGFRLMAGKRIAIAGMSNKLTAFSTRLAPRTMLAKIARGLNT